VFAHGQGPQQQPATPVEVALVIEREVVAGQTLVGTVMPARTSVVGSAVDGRVIELFVDEGDPVGLIDEGEPAERVGQPMVQLRTGTISIQVQAAQAELELRRQELAELENGTRPEEIVQAEARFSETKALMDYAKASYSRIERLFRQNTANREEMEQARSAALAAEQAHLAARAAHELAVAGPRKEKIGQARARVMVQEEEVRRIEDMRAKYTIRAPFVGYVVTKHAEVGQWTPWWKSSSWIRSKYESPCLRPTWRICARASAGVCGSTVCPVKCSRAKSGGSCRRRICGRGPFRSRCGWQIRADRTVTCSSQACWST
jgi:multidrug efflux pump subunit AcrA (membrane-fusion protein)